MQPETSPSADWMNPPPDNPAPRPVYTTADSVYALCCVLLGYMGVRWQFFGGYGFGTTAMLLLFCLATGMYLHKTGETRLTPARWIWLALLAAFSTSFSLYEQAPVSFLCAFFLFLLGTLWIVRTGREGPLLRGCWPADAFRALFILPFATLSGLPGALRRCFTRLPAKKPLRGVLLGLLLAIPVTLVVGTLLLQADEAFSSLLHSVMQIGLGKAAREIFLSLLYLVLGLPAAAALFSLVYSSRRHIKEGVCGQTSWERMALGVRFAPGSVLYAALTPVCILYVLFFVAQSAYFLAAFQNLLPAGFTYADYARRGFFELCAVAVINLLLVAVLQAFCKRKEGATHASGGARFYTIMLAVFTLLLIATALRKMLLYIDSYGLTPLRVYTSWFMLLLAALFLLILLKQVFVCLPFVRVTGLITVILLGVLCFGNVNGRIAHYNVQHYLSGDLPDMDVALVDSLGSEAVPSLVLLAEEQTEAGRQARICLRHKKAQLNALPLAKRSVSYYTAMAALRSPSLESLLQSYQKADEAPLYVPDSYEEQPYASL